MFTPSQLEVVAQILASIKPSCNTGQWDKTVLAFTDRFSHEHEDFNRIAFMKACKY